ncbi:hypothetical protein [Rosistilla oblonga]|uniref:hypothetical protein n=1 Tax=Rosistilla oblonga TaxID=2527990 RepID=UPI003A97AFFD
MSVPFLNLDGIPTDTPPEDGAIYFALDPQGAWYPNCDTFLYDIDSACVTLHDSFAKSLFGGLEQYHAFLPAAPEFLSTAGMNSESTVSRADFAKLVEQFPTDRPFNLALYLYDCRKLVSGIQECSKEVMQLQGEFYAVLNLEEFFFPSIDEPDGIRYVSSPVVTKLTTLLGGVFIRLHSLLDYVTKVAYEIENLQTSFDSYPKLSAKSILYGDRKRISLNKSPGTLFEPCTLITEIEAVRNHLIHDGLLDDLPKAYRVIRDQACVEKFVLFPDRTDEGHFEKFKNRTLFYGTEDKINQRLPDLVIDFMRRLHATTKALQAQIDPPNEDG